MVRNEQREGQSKKGKSVYLMTLALLRLVTIPGLWLRLETCRTAKRSPEGALASKTAQQSEPALASVHRELTE